MHIHICDVYKFTVKLHLLNECVVLLTKHSVYLQILEQINVSHLTYRKFPVTRLTHVFSANSTFCLLKGGIWLVVSYHILGTDTDAWQGTACPSIQPTLPTLCWDKCKWWSIKFGLTLCLWLCPVLFGVVYCLPRTAVGPTKGDFVDWMTKQRGHAKELVEGSCVKSA